jgi:SAM-dependent methyltransferase
MQMFTSIIKLTNFSKIRVKSGICPACGRTVFVKLGENAWAVRCLRCRGSIAALGMAAALKELVPDFRKKAVYEMSSRGAFWNFLRANVSKLTFSEFYDSVKPGDFFQGVQCQDVQRLTFADSSFDVCTNTEVFEHVPGDARGFAEIYRVLKPGGLLLFTVPLSESVQTVERARIGDEGAIIHMQEPEYHNDRIRGDGTVLCFRTYGRDILERLRHAGFVDAQIINPQDSTGWGYLRPVIAAFKPVMK